MFKIMKMRRRATRSAEDAWSRPAPDPDLQRERIAEARARVRPDPALAAGLMAEPERRRAFRRDPAPSRIAYRWHRLWLTPLFRAVLRVGVPAFAIAFLAGWYLSDQENADAVFAQMAEFRQSIEERPEFMVQLMAIDGASDNLAADIREVLPLDFPISSFYIDLPAVRTSVEELSAVASVDVRVRAGGVLQIDVTERQPALLWRQRGGYALLDAEGVTIADGIPRAAGESLPLIAGDGADQAVTEAASLYVAAQPLGARLLGLQRIGERRWDLVLDREQRILLPEDDPIPALERVIALSTAQDLLARDLTIVDMRNAARPTIRLADNAVAQLRRIKGIEWGAISE